MDDSSHVISDNRFMREALRLAAAIPRRPWPNPPVGAVVVRDGLVIGRGAHHGAGTGHAEVAALAAAGGAARGATLYCTLEPCNHHGRTPPCAPAVVAAGIARVVVGVLDPNPRVCGGGLACLRAAGIETELGVLGDEALELAWPFVVTNAFERPFVVLKTATSIDGRLAPADSVAGRPVYLTGEEARRDAHRLRRWSDVVLVGENTMRLDHPQLDGRLVRPEDGCPALDPLPAYADTDLSLQAGWPRAHWVFAGRQAATEARRRGIERNHGTVVLCDERDGHLDPVSIVAEFGRRGGLVLLVEGGPTIASRFLQAGVVDRWISYIAPVHLGSGVGWPNVSGDARFHVTRTELLGPDVKLTFDRYAFAARRASITAARGGA